MDTNFIKTGHRGCRGLMPENTIISFVEAIKLGCNAIELDVVISGDKKVVVSHEAYMNPKICLTPNGEEIKDSKEYNLYKMDYDEIKKFDVGTKAHPDFDIQLRFEAFKPLLKDVIEEVERYTTAYNIPPITYDIEIKSTESEYGISQPHPEEMVDLVMSVLSNLNIQDRVIIRSFDVKPLQYLRECYPSVSGASGYPYVKIALLVENELTPDQNLMILGFVPNFYSPKFELVDDECVNFCKMYDIKILPWTVNDVADMEALINKDVHGIITDYPNLFQFLQI